MQCKLKNIGRAVVRNLLWIIGMTLIWGQIIFFPDLTRRLRQITAYSAIGLLILHYIIAYKRKKKAGQGIGREE